MEKRLKEINRNMQKGEYSLALSRMHSMYGTFYQKKIQLSRAHPSKSFVQIANLECPRVKEWLTLFNKFNNGCDGMIESIKNTAKDEGRFVSVEGDDIFKKMMSYRNHCKIFASKKNFSK